MNSNNIDISNIEEISDIILDLNSKDEIQQFLSELLTDTEISTLSKRWRILKMLSQNLTQREISKELNVSLCKVTRGAKILKDKNAIVTRLLNKED